MMVPFDGNYGTAFDINNNNVVVGTAPDGNGGSQGMTFANGSLTPVPGMNAAYAINDNGDIVGAALVDNADSSGKTWQLLLYRQDQIIDLGKNLPDPPFPGQPAFAVVKLTNQGVILMSSEISAGDTFVGFPAPPGGGTFLATDINDDGVIVGNIYSYSTDPDGSRVGVVLKDGIYTPLSDLMPQGGPTTDRPYTAHAINNAGQIVASTWKYPYAWSLFLMTPVAGEPPTPTPTPTPTTTPSPTPVASPTPTPTPTPTPSLATPEHRRKDRHKPKPPRVRQPRVLRTTSSQMRFNGSIKEPVWVQVRTSARVRRGGLYKKIEIRDPKYWSVWVDLEPGRNVIRIRTKAPGNNRVSRSVKVVVFRD